MNKHHPFFLRICSVALAIMTFAVAQAFCPNEKALDEKLMTGDSIDVEGYMDFLYRSMALPDRYDYSKDFYRRNVMAAMKSRKEMPWGARIPEREFRHFILPIRVNNENMDDSRMVFYDELRQRVSGLSMHDAILEVNHWCHEKATYRPSDARTSSPLATVKTAYGRCGEESTLLVAALRSVCIPARQVYTPRWAHTDDNHAWVEAWADGQWYFLGACEPEPVLNLGWFNESASRGMLMHTKVFGDYDGPEEVMSQTPCYTEINVVDHYAPVSQMDVAVVDANGHAVAGALVEFKLYNYAEFYTVAQKATDTSGHTQLTAGLGDMLLWVTKDGMATFKKVSFGKQRQVTIVLDDRPLPPFTEIDIVPPPVSATLPVVTPGQRAENNRRLAQEDSIRQRYEQTMPHEAWRGNHEVIQRFLDEAKNPQMARRLLEVISPKDLRDITLEVLKDNEVTVVDTTEIFGKYLLNPRVENEWLTPYKAFFRQQFQGVLRNPRDLVKWCTDHLLIDSVHNPQQLRMRPMSVYESKVTDELGRKIFFVSVARSLGWPSRINEVDGTLQYDEHGVWQDVNFQAQQLAAALPPATLVLRYNPVEYYDDPKYYIHFTLSKLENGRPQLLTYPEDATWRGYFSEGMKVTRSGDNDEYLLTTGTRMASGKVLATIQRITIPHDETSSEVTFTMREDKQNVQVIGSFNAENKYRELEEASEPKTLLSTTGRGYNVLGIIAPGLEPTNHALRDICASKEEWEKWGRKVMLLFENDEEAQRFNFQEFSQMPATVQWGFDVDGKCLKEISEQMNLPSPMLPVFIIYDSFNRVVFAQQGYTINLAEQLLKVIKKLND